MWLIILLVIVIAAVIVCFSLAAAAKNAEMISQLWLEKQRINLFFCLIALLIKKPLLYKNCI